MLIAILILLFATIILGMIIPLHKKQPEKRHREKVEAIAKLSSPVVEAQGWLTSVRIIAIATTLLNPNASLWTRNMPNFL